MAATHAQNTSDPLCEAPNIYSEQNALKRFVRSIMNLVGINLRHAVAPGISLFGRTIFHDDRRGPHRARSAYALDYALKLKPKTVLDVGSGGGYHANAFVNAGSQVLCVDYGTSVYAKQSSVDDLDVTNVDFNEFQCERKFDLVWASHILEHQRNVGEFIEKLIECCSEDGRVCITVPDPHRDLLGGHVSLWSPGLLAYNVVLCGVDISDAVFVRGTNEFSIFFRPKRVSLPENLTFDNGDLRKLSKYLPQDITEDTDPWRVSYSS